MGSRFDTEIGGHQGRFSTTRWTVIIDSQVSDENRKRIILDELFRKYWKPVYHYIRRKGHNNEKAKDLTQGFFSEIVWGRDLIQFADPQKGRFRNFLLTALERYLTDTWRYEHSQKRMPAKEIFAYDASDGFELADTTAEMNAEETFNIIWLMEILQKSLAEVKEDMQTEGMGHYWILFEKRCLEPILNTTKPLPLKEICATFSIEDVTKASNMIVTVKRRLKKVIASNLKSVIGPEIGLEDEIATLIGKISI